MGAYHQSLSRLTTTAFCAFLLCNAVAYAIGFEDKCRYESGSAIVRIGLESALPTVDQSKSAHELGRLVAHGKGYKHIGLTEALLQRRFAVSSAKW